jgi:hypothetical protein
MVLMGMCLLRYAVRLGMRGVAAGIHGDMVDHPLHRRALNTLITATAAAGETGGASVEVCAFPPFLPVMAVTCLACLTNRGVSCQQSMEGRVICHNFA